MLTFELVINPVILLISSVLSAFFGYLLFRYKLAKSESRIKHLEKEMLNSHFEILELQKTNMKLESEVKEETSIPVIPMKISGKEGASPKEKASK